MTINLLKTGCIFAIAAVMLGAFAAHGLKVKIDPDKLAIFQTGVKYQFYHSFGIFIAALMHLHYPDIKQKYAAWMFSIGIFLFSGSLYLLACRFWLNIDHWTWLGPLTPIGGTCFIIGWALLFFSVNKKNNL